MDKIEYLHRFDQMTGAFRETADALTSFREALIANGFTEEGAENLTEILFTAAITHE